MTKVNESRVNGRAGNEEMNRCHLRTGDAAVGSDDVAGDSHGFFHGKMEIINEGRIEE